MESKNRAITSSIEMWNNLP